MTFKKCSLKAGITSEDMAEIRQYIQRAGNDVQGVQDYLDGLDADLNDLRNQTGTQLVTEQVETEGEAITGDVVDLIRSINAAFDPDKADSPLLLDQAQEVEIKQVKKVAARADENAKRSLTGIRRI